MENKAHALAAGAFVLARGQEPAIAPEAPMPKYEARPEQTPAILASPGERVRRRALHGSAFCPC